MMIPIPTSSFRLALFVALALPISGCDQVNELVGKKEEKAEKKKSKKSDDDEEEDEDENKKGSTSASATASASAAPSATPTAEPTPSASASATGEATPSASGSAPAPTATSLPGHSPVPTTAEWEAASEVTVINSSKLGCETKALREWVRVNCKGKNDTGGQANSVSIHKGNEKNELFTYTTVGLASLVFPFSTGTDVQATVGWDDGKSSKFTSQWPNGSPKPAAYGKFDLPSAAVATPTKKDPPKAEPVKKDPPKVEPPKPPLKKERTPKK
ncbi:MAG: hypothetical protein JNK04_21815 [Myxococcales bacterium]|nr:hypothetical protein [Myxococcales bacterium]